MSKEIIHRQRPTPDIPPVPKPDSKLSRRKLFGQFGNFTRGVLATWLLTELELGIFQLTKRAMEISQKEGGMVWNYIMHRAPEVPSALSQPILISGNPIVIAVGDSVMAGVEGIPPVTLVTEYLRRKGINAHQLIVAVAGSDTDNIIVQDQKADKELHGVNHRIVLVETGENDPFHDATIKALIEQYVSNPHNPLLLERLIIEQKRFLKDFKERYKSDLKYILNKGDIEHLIIFGMLPVQWAKNIIHLNDQGVADFSIQVEGNNFIQLVLANFIFEGTKIIIEIAQELLNEGYSVRFINTPGIISAEDFSGITDQHINTNGYQKLAGAVEKLFLFVQDLTHTLMPRWGRA